MLNQHAHSPAEANPGPSSQMMAMFLAHGTWPNWSDDPPPENDPWLTEGILDVSERA